jgi:hypothetical protein
VDVLPVVAEGGVGEAGFAGYEEDDGVGHCEGRVRLGGRGGEGSRAVSFRLMVTALGLLSADEHVNSGIG